MNLKLLLQTLGLFAVFNLGNYFSCRNNRKQLKEDYYAVGAFKKGTSGDMDCEEDLLSFLGVLVFLVWSQLVKCRFSQGSKLGEQ